MTDKAPASGHRPRIPEGAAEDPDWPRYPSGEPMPETHPDHGPMRDIPRRADGSIAPYYYCSKAELEKWGELDRPPARRRRHDGWTPERIEKFLEALRATASITDACRVVGKSRQSAYKLYNRKDSAHIRKAWDEALRACTNILATTAFDRAVNGTEEQVFHDGHFVGWRTRYDNRHLQWMLRARDPVNWAPLSELQGWMRQRAIERHEPVEASLERVAKAEEEWGQCLPGEDVRDALPEPAEKGDADGGGEGDG
ncbi:MAG: hypothetical protein ACTS1X_10080 [Parasphingopyxis sp.]|uniref:hypothetical protein n=1 Tax=Parasphingopyxis sp. TaxID=1920299 RepID=UPI003FA0E013